MPVYQFIACHPITRQQLAPPLRLGGDVKWTEAVSSNGELTASLTLPGVDAYVDSQLIAAVEPDESAIYIKNIDTNTFEWGGIVVERNWKSYTRTFEFRCAEWRSWLGQAFLAPKVDLTGDNTYSWTNTEQLQIARDIVTYATAGGTTDGRPSITLGSEVSGKARDLNVVGLNFKTAAELLDAISQRSGGFEWSIETPADQIDLLPRLKLGLYFPEENGVLDGLIFKITPGGSNCTLADDIQWTTDSRRTRCWATGEAETQPFAVDSDPDISKGTVLLRERVDNYTSVIDRTTLASHARSVRLFYSPKTTLMKLRASLTTPLMSSVRAGHRGRLLYKDTHFSFDLPAVRVISREVQPYVGSGQVEFVLDLSDYKLPEVDTAGTV